MSYISAFFNFVIRFYNFIRQNLQQWREFSPIFIVEEVEEFENAIKIRIKNVGRTIKIKNIIPKTKNLLLIGIDDEFETTRYSVKYNLTSPFPFPENKNFYFRFETKNLLNKNSIKFQIEYWDSRNIKDRQSIIPYKETINIIES